MAATTNAGPFSQPHIPRAGPHFVLHLLVGLPISQVVPSPPQAAARHQPSPVQRESPTVRPPDVAKPFQLGEARPATREGSLRNVLGTTAGERGPAGRRRRRGVWQRAPDTRGVGGVFFCITPATPRPASDRALPSRRGVYTGRQWRGWVDLWGVVYLRVACLFAGLAQPDGLVRRPPSHEF